jgi:hypothetical protein
VKTSTFVKGLVLMLVLMAAGLVGLGVLNHSQNRPEGVAERWLTAVGDTTRKGVEADARKRAEKIGPVSLATHLIEHDAKAINRKTGFEDLEVGKAVHEAAGVRVGFRVHAKRPNDKTVEITGVLGLAKVGDKWMVQTLDTGEVTAMGVPALPSEGGPPPSSAGASLWLGGLVGAAIIGLVTTSLVRLAGRPAAAVATA